MVNSTFPQEWLPLGHQSPEDSDSSNHSSTHDNIPLPLPTPLTYKDDPIKPNHSLLLPRTLIATPALHDPYLNNPSGANDTDASLHHSSPKLNAAWCMFYLTALNPSANTNTHNTQPF
jgi:hypothetical protein